MYIYNMARFRIHLACNAIDLSINRSFTSLITHMGDFKIKYVNLILKKRRISWKISFFNYPLQRIYKLFVEITCFKWLL